MVASKLAVNIHARHEEGEIIEAAHIADDGAEAETEGKKVEHRVDHLQGKRGPDGFLPDQKMAPPDGHAIGQTLRYPVH